MERKDEGRSTEEIEVTPEMIEAGVSVLCGYETLTAGESYWAGEVYRAMRAVAPDFVFRDK
jgi:hypothetical protein